MPSGANVVHTAASLGGGEARIPSSRMFLRTLPKSNSLAVTLAVLVDAHIWPNPGMEERTRRRLVRVSSAGGHSIQSDMEVVSKGVR
jgi:hypothetical protein